MNIKQKVIGVLAAIIVFLGGGYAANLGGTSSGVRSTIATSSFQVYTAATGGRAIATSTICSSRIISTQGSEIRLTFNDLAPSAINGLAQGASTTVAYDSELYGCGAVRVFPYGAQTITVVETR